MSARCQNCDAPLDGDFCGRCGQSSGSIDLPVTEFAKDFASEALGLDSRFRHTVWPLVRYPGRVAREYVEGHRARFVPPIRLYLLTSFVMFILLSFGELEVNSVDVDGRQVSRPTLSSAPGSDAPPDSVATGGTVLAGDTIVSPDSTVPTDSLRLTESDSATDSTIVVTAPGLTVNLGTDELNDRVAVGFQRLMDDPRGFSQVFVDQLARAMIVLLPFFALLMKLMWRTRWFVHHMVFAMYFHSFAFGVIALSSLPSLIGAEALGSALDVLILLIPIHLFLATRRFYGPAWSIYPKTLFVLMTYTLTSATVVLALLFWSLLSI